MAALQLRVVVALAKLQTGVLPCSPNLHCTPPAGQACCSVRHLRMCSKSVAIACSMLHIHLNSRQHIHASAVR